MVYIISAVVSGIFGILSAFIASYRTGNLAYSKFIASQAVTEEKISELTREVREHNNFARRMPVIEEQIKVINHRIGDLENESKIQKMD